MRIGPFYISKTRLLLGKKRHMKLTLFRYLMEKVLRTGSRTRYPVR